jgi:SAM-dependent methyltransferase
VIPATTTKFGSIIPEDFRALDMGTGTGNIPISLIDFGVKPENIVGIDNNPEMLADACYPAGVRKICADARKFLPMLNDALPKFGNFDLVTANMVFHLLSFGDYVKALKQVRKVVTERAQLYIMVPHPLRDKMDSIPDYYQRKMVPERAPWGEEITYGTKTISDYCRGLREAGFSCWIIRTTGVGLRLEDNLLLSDEAIWSRVQDRKRGMDKGTLPHYFRLWLMAFPE